MQLFVFFIFLFLVNLRFAENILCIPPSVPAKDKQGVDCCKIPPEIFPHPDVYEQFCTILYFGIMADGPEGRFCRLSSTQLKHSIPCEQGWLKFYEGINQFCYKAFTISENDILDVSGKEDGDPCVKQRNESRLVRIPNQNINMFLYVKVIKGANNVSCNAVDEKTFYYYTGLFRRDFDWRWKLYDEKAYSHLEEQAYLLLDYLNSPHPEHLWSDGKRIFAEGWDKTDGISTNVVISNCGMWRDFNNTYTNFKHNGKHVPNQGFICAYHV